MSDTTQKDSIFKKLNLFNEGDLSAKVNVSLDLEVYFYLGITIIIAMMVGTALATISKNVINQNS